jgi:hypothetical protein
MRHSYWWHLRREIVKERLTLIVVGALCLALGLVWFVWSR